MALSVEAAFACGGFLPVSAELPLLGAALHPASPHTGTFEIFRPHGAAQGAAGCGATSFGPGGRLWVGHIFKCLVEKSRLWMPEGTT